MDCFETISAAPKVVALTGAGVSTLSGIPDFRGANGVYVKEPYWHGYRVEELYDTEIFSTHPEAFYQYAAEVIYPMTCKLPSIAHRTLAAMEKAGKLSALYTQNIDTLHTQAGSRNVGELHGSMSGHHCLKCGSTFPLEPARSEAMAGKLPRCPECGGLLKPDVVFYGDMLDQQLLERAFRDMETADVLLVMGSSLTVQPVASLPQATRTGGGKIVIVNDAPTSFDRDAAWCFRDIAEFCRDLCAFLKINVNQ